MTSSSDRTEQTDAERLEDIEYEIRRGRSIPFEDVAWLLARLQEVEAENARLKAVYEHHPDFECWCGRPYTYHAERWGSAWGAASMPLEWHPYEAASEHTEHQRHLRDRRTRVWDELKRRAEAAEARIHEQEEVIQAAYRERNAVVAALGRLFPSWVGTDAEEPDWPVLYISLPTGQVSWHFSAADANLLDGIPRGDGVWDGHTTAEKYARLAALGAASSATGEAKS